MFGRCRSTVILFAAFVVFLSIIHPAHPATRTVEGVVKKVADGDTLTTITPERTKLRVRLYGIDAPEIRHGKKPGQPYGEEAKAVTNRTLRDGSPEMDEKSLLRGKL